MSSFSLARLIEQQTTGADGAYPTAIRGLTLFKRSAPTPPTGVMYEPAFCVIAQGTKHVVLGDKKYRYDADRYLLIAANMPAMAWITRATPKVPYLSLKLLLDPLEVGEIVAQLGPEQEVPTTRAMAVNSLDSGMLDTVTRLVALLDDSQDALVLAPLIRREITYRLLRGPEGARLRQIVSGTDQGQRITLALKWLRDHYAEPFRIDAIAKRAGMSPSAFHRHFKAVTALSPIQYQKRIRLQESRLLMLGKGLDAAEASFRVGYESPSQFNREYRRLFGAPPRQDIDALRQSQAPAEATGLDTRKKGAAIGMADRELVLAHLVEH